MYYIVAYDPKNINDNKESQWCGEMAKDIKDLAKKLKELKNNGYEYQSFDISTDRWPLQGGRNVR